MATKRIKWEGGFIVIRSGTVQDDINGQVMESKLLNASGEDAVGLYRQFGQLCSQAVKSEGIPFHPESMMEANLFILQAAYNSFTRMEKSLRDKWLAAQTQLNRDDGITIDDGDDNPDPKSAAAQTEGGTTSITGNA